MIFVKIPVISGTSTENNTFWEDDNISEITDTYKPPTPFEEMGGVEEDEEE